MRHSTKGTAALLCVAMVSSGCATARSSFAELASERDRISELDARLGRIGRFPGAATMTPDVRLVTFPYATPGSTEQRRDTVVGEQEVEAWLVQWHARQLPEVDFVLTSHDVRSCDGAAAQSGTFPMARTASQAPPVAHPYRALWVRRPDGAWALRRLWLQPDVEARREAVAGGCRSLGQTERALHRFSVSAGSAWAGTPAAPPAEEAMTTAGWGYDLRGQTFPWTSKEGTSYTVAVAYRLTPLLGVEGVFVQNPATSTHGRHPSHATEIELRELDRVVAVLASVDLGLVRLGAGPALATVDLDWTPRYSRLDPVSTARTTHGAMAQAVLVAPLAARVRPYASIRYVALGDVEVPPFYDMTGRFSVPLGRAGFSLGMQVAF